MKTSYKLFWTGVLSKGFIYNAFTMHMKKTSAWNEYNIARCALYQSVHLTGSLPGLKLIYIHVDIVYKFKKALKALFTRTICQLYMFQCD